MIFGPKTIAGFMTIFATEVWMILVVRFINGVADTAGIMAVMIYCTEIASNEIRGSLGSLIPLLSSLGALIILGIGPYVSYRNLSIMYTAIIICASIPILFIPDTPYSLYSKGKIEEAERVLIFLRESKIIAQEELKQFSRREPKQKFDKRDLFRNKAYLKGLMISVVMGIGVEAIGFNCITFYLQTILELTNTNVSSAFGSVVIGCIQLVSCIVTSIYSDRFGRKIILVTTLFGMAAGMMSLGVFFTLKRHGVSISGFLNYLPVISVGFINWCYGGGIGSQFLVLISELLDGPARALITSICMEVSTITAFFVTKYTIEMITVLGSNTTFFMFGVVCVLLSLFVLFFVPETKHKTIAEIQNVLRGEERLEKHIQGNGNISRL
ncbi:facilitated trehalose transporter Tret1-like [Epargyreus clarus]|uniref:facilitated trehalose transporter Tret1-like n=1 Tax=Epargyreus clarus TaxID=520877 RepID=UPI003C2EEC28